MDRDASNSALKWGDRWLVSHAPLAVALVLGAAAFSATVSPAPWLQMFAVFACFFGVTMGLVLRSARGRVRRADSGNA
jgi:hypothetical protein